MKKFDTVIVGAGIGGLSAAHQLANLDVTNNRLAIFEANEYVGGRILSNGGCDLGAGRYCPGKHPFLHQLINEFSIPIEDFQYEVSFGCRHEQLMTKQSSRISQLLLSSEKDDFKRTPSFFESAAQCLGVEEAVNLCKYSGYDALLNPGLSFDVGLSIIMNHPESIVGKEDNCFKWMKVKSGFQELPKKMFGYLQQIGVDTHLSHKLLKIDKSIDGYVLTFENKAREHFLVKSAVVILSLQKEALRSIKLPSQYSQNLSAISGISLFKCFVHFKEIPSVLKNYRGKCIVTKNHIRKLYIPKDTNYIFFYCDSESADFWESIFSKSRQEINSTVISLVAETVGARVYDFKEEFYLENKYWDLGVSFLSIDKNICKKHEYAIEIDENLFFCSDTFTNNSGWIEGSIQSADYVANQIKNLVNVKTA